MKKYLIATSTTMFHKCSIYYLLLLFLPLVKSVTFGDTHLQTPLNEAGEDTFLKVVFPGGEIEYVRNWECPDGIWAEDLYLKRKPNCVCVKGVYAIGTSLCDDDFKILTGDDHCYDIRGHMIRKFLPLTGNLGFRGKANTVFRSDAAYFARLNSPTPTTSVSETVQYVFRMNDPMTFTAYARLSDGQAARLKCFPGQPFDETGNPVMQIAMLPNCSNEFRGPKEWCNEGNMMGEYQWNIQLGESWSKSGDKMTGQKFPGNCGGDDNGKIRKGSSPNKMGRKKRWAPKHKGAKGRKPGGPSPAERPIQNVHQEICSKFDDNQLEPEEFDTSSDHFFQAPIPTNLLPKFHSASLHQKEVNMQNRRVGHYIRKFFLGGDTRLDGIPKFKEFKEWKFVQIGKELLKKICPKDYVPPDVIDFFIRAFRVLYIDSSHGYPYPIVFNEHEHKRIEDALNKCSVAAAEQPIEFIRNSSCPDLGILATNQSMNATTYAVTELKGTKVNKKFTMPGDVVFNVSSMDISVELVWKSTMLTYYYCADHFTTNPFDFSALFVKMEAFLKNPSIMFRWYYPGQFNRLAQIFLMNVNLAKFARGIDRCVETVFARSTYKEWLKRPAEEVLWSAKPKLLPHEVSKTIHSPTDNFGKGRKKRFYLQDDIWNRSAYCMHNTDAPYVEVRTGTFLSCRKKPMWFDNTDS